MFDPLKLISLSKTEKYKQPKKIYEEEYTKLKENKNNQEYIQTISNLNYDILKINEMIKPLQEEYEKEILYRKELQLLFNGDKNIKKLLKK